MATTFSDPARARDFAVAVVDRLRRSGHETYWAGGCVRDDLLGRTPADYDVATAARPEEVRDLFGRRRTLAVGAAFGVITVLGPKGAGQVEVATFRADAPSTDGRHPAGVTFCSAREDALRRDFTINGLFLDPLSGEIHDFVGGRDDLAAGIVRAIGQPVLRFGEDHLRMLRAVRFAAFFGFVLETETRAAIERMARLVATVSPERIAAELRSMVSRPGRRRALELLAETGLAAVIFPEFASGAGPGGAMAQAARVLDAVDEPDLPIALAILAGGDAAVLPRLAGRLRLSNHEAKAAGWLAAAVADLEAPSAAAAQARPWSAVQPWLADPRAPRLTDMLRARAACGLGSATTAAWLTAQLARPRAEIDPPPLLSGDDLVGLGIARGPAVGDVLKRLRRMQLDGGISSRDEALAIARAAAG
jgi:tRNA nucleotidyltransferase/poly(A) polymerase